MQMNIRTWSAPQLKKRQLLLRQDSVVAINHFLKDEVNIDISYGLGLGEVDKAWEAVRNHCHNPEEPAKIYKAKFYHDVNLNISKGGDKTDFINPYPHQFPNPEHDKKDEIRVENIGGKWVAWNSNMEEGYDIFNFPVRCFFLTLKNGIISGQFEQEH